MGTTTVSAKIPKELKKQLDSAEINISAAIREALEAEIRRQRRAELRERAAEVKSSIAREELTTAIRLDRDER